MAGLMDILGSDTGLLGLQLMAAGSAKPVRTGFGEGLLGALQSVQAQRAAEKDRAMKEQMQLAQLGLIGAQTEETKAQAAARLAAGEEARKKSEQLAQQQAQAMERMRAFQGALGGPTSPQQALAEGGGPTPANAARIGQVQAPNWQALALQFPDQIELIKKLSESGNFGRQEVGRVEETMVDGRPVRQQFDKFGAPIGAALPQWKAPVMSDTGGAINAIDPVTLKVLTQLTKTNTPDALLSAQTTMRGQNLTDARARESNQTQATNGRIPPGYRLRADGNLEAIPGGPADIKAGEIGAKTEQRRQMAVQSAGSVLDTVKDARDLVGLSTAGLGGTLQVIPATNARNLAAKIETIKANLGFDRLQQMREASPTGGALGAVAVQELTALQSTVASLDQLQSPAQLTAALDKIDKHYNGWLKTLKSDGGATVMRTGRDAQGRKVEQMSDGSIRYGKD